MTLVHNSKAMICSTGINMEASEVNQRGSSSTVMCRKSEFSANATLSLEDEQI